MTPSRLSIRSIFAGAYAGIAFALVPAFIALFLPMDLHVPSVMIGGAVAGIGVPAWSSARPMTDPTPPSSPERPHGPLPWLYPPGTSIYARSRVVPLKNPETALLWVATAAAISHVVLFAFWLFRDAQATTDSKEGKY